MNSTNPILQPLEGLRFARFGVARVGSRLGEMLLQQGATVVPASANPDIVIDDTTGTPDTNAALEAACATSARIGIRFTDLPKFHPRWTGTVCLVDEIIQAEAGLNMENGENEAEPLALASAYGAFWGGVHVATALRRRSSEGRGTYIELPLFTALQTLLGRKLSTIAPPLVDPRLVPSLSFQQLYRCADDRYIQTHGTFLPFARAMCKAVGKPEWIDEVVVAFYSCPDWDSARAWQARFGEIFLTRPAHEWEEICAAHGAVATVSRTREEWMTNEHAAKVGLFDGPGGVRAISAVRLRTPGPVVKASKPIFAPAEAGAAEAPKAMPLAGLKVLDFCVILAGPACGRTLSELGADVIKIDSPTRTMDNPLGWMEVQRGKRSILLNLKHDEGLRICQQLVKDSDVLLENLRQGKMSELGMGYEQARAIKPGIVYVSTNAFDFGGPWTLRPGWEHSAQATSGMQTARARRGAPRLILLPVNDYSTGLVAAFGVLLALQHAQRTGQSVHINGSLARTASFIQTDELKAAMPQLSAPRTAATLAIQCADGWIRVVQPDTPAQSERLATVAQNLGGVACADAIKQLAAQQFYAVLERRIIDNLNESWRTDSPLHIDWQHPAWGRFTQAISAPNKPENILRPGWPSPDLGGDTETILAGLGYDAGKIAALIAAGAVRSRVPLFPRGIMPEGVQSGPRT